MFGGGGSACLIADLLGKRDRSALKIVIGHMMPSAWLVAGGTALRGLLDRLLSDLRKLLPGGPRQRGAPTASWQLSAASIVVVTTEVIYGASVAWQPANYLGAQPGPAHAGEDSSASGTSLGERLQQNQAEVEAMGVMIEEEWVREPLWGVMTSTEASQNESGASLTPQVHAASSSTCDLDSQDTSVTKSQHSASH